MQKYLQQSSKVSTSNHFWNLKKTCSKPCFETAYLGKNVMNLLDQKVAKNVDNSLGYFIFWKKIVTSLQKKPNWQKIAQSGHPA